MYRSPLTVLMIGLLATMAGCAAPKDLSGQTLPPTVPELVQIYQGRPRAYSIVGRIEIPMTPEMKLDARGESPKFFETVKALAAAKGANGVLFRDDPGSAGVTTTMGYHGAYYQVPMQLHPAPVAIGTAIWVKPKSNPNRH